MHQNLTDGVRCFRVQDKVICRAILRPKLIVFPADPSSSCRQTYTRSFLRVSGAALACPRSMMVRMFLPDLIVP